MPLKKATQAVISPNICTTDTTQTITGTKTFSQPISGNLTGNITGNVTGNAGTATTLQTARTIAISGAITGTATSFNGATGIVIPTTITSGATITSPVFAGNATGSIISSVLQGVTDGTSAASGFVGQVVSSTIPVGSAVALTANVIANVTSISLPAGEWYVNGQVNYRAGATTSITSLTQGISQTSVQLGGQDTFSRSVMAAVIPTAANDIGIAIRGQRIVLTAQTTIFLIAIGIFTVSTLSAYGTIEARRVR